MDERKKEATGYLVTVTCTDHDSLSSNIAKYLKGYLTHSWGVTIDEEQGKMLHSDPVTWASEMQAECLRAYGATIKIELVPMVIVRGETIHV